MKSKRYYIHRHNSFQGHIKMSQAQMMGIMQSRTASDSSKDMAYQIWHKLKDLGKSLKDRDDTWIKETFK